MMLELQSWKDGDHLELPLGMSLRLIPTDKRNTSIVALVNGPVALFAIEPGSQKITQKQLLAQRVSSSSSE